MMWFCVLNRFKNDLFDFRVQHQGDLDDKIEDHKNECDTNEQKMVDLHDIMDDTAHLNEVTKSKHNQTKLFYILKLDISIIYIVHI